MKAIATYFSQVRSEAKRVVWPKRENVVRLTLIVIIISIIVGAYVGLLDVTFVKLLETVISA